MLSFDVNNGRKLNIIQYKHDQQVFVTTTPDNNQYTISNGDFVMLLNLYHYIKDNDIQNDFINPTGKNKED